MLCCHVLTLWLICMCHDKSGDWQYETFCAAGTQPTAGISGTSLSINSHFIVLNNTTHLLPFVLITYLICSQCQRCHSKCCFSRRWKPLWAAPGPKLASSTKSLTSSRPSPSIKWAAALLSASCGWAEISSASRCFPGQSQLFSDRLHSWDPGAGRLLHPGHSDTDVDRWWGRDGGQRVRCILHRCAVNVFNAVSLIKTQSMFDRNEDFLVVHARDDFTALHGTTPYTHSSPGTPINMPWLGGVQTGRGAAVVRHVKHTWKMPDWLSHWLAFVSSCSSSKETLIMWDGWHHTPPYHIVSTLAVLSYAVLSNNSIKRPLKNITLKKGSV